MSRQKKEVKSQINANQAGVSGVKTKAEYKALLDTYAEQNPEKWEMKKDVLLKRLELLPE